MPTAPVVVLVFPVLDTVTVGAAAVTVRAVTSTVGAVPVRAVVVLLGAGADLQLQRETGAAAAAAPLQLLPELQQVQGGACAQYQSPKLSKASWTLPYIT